MSAAAGEALATAAPGALPLAGLACLVLAHDNAEQLGLLLGWLGRHGARCHLHLDARAAATRAALEAAPPPGCRLLPRQHCLRIAWGGFAMVEATLRLMRAAAAEEGTRAMILLSGTHLPIRPPAAIARHLLDGREHIDLGFAAAAPMEHKSLRRFWYRALPGREERRTLLRWANRSSWRLGRRDLARDLRGLTPMTGAQWWCLSAGCARHMLRFVDENPWYPRFFRLSSIPDEGFFHTLLGASAFAENRGPAPLFQCMEGYSPRLLTTADLGAAAASGMPFARKFDARADAAAVRAAMALAEGG